MTFSFHIKRYNCNSFTSFFSKHPAVMVFLSISISFCALRITLPNYIFDDTRHIYNGYLSLKDSQMHINFKDVCNIVYNEFSNDSSREYRPLSFAQHSLIITAYAGDLSKTPLIPIIIVSLGWGLLGAMYSIFSRRFLGTVGKSLLATGFFITSMPVLTSSWIVVMGWQWVVTLSIVLGLLCYQNYKTHNKRLWIFLLALVAIIGSWFREFSGIFVFVLLLHELLFVKNRSWLLLFIFGLLGFHVIFPAFLANILLLGKLNKIALTPIFAMGPIGALSSSGSTLLKVANLRWDALYHFVLLFPPCLWILSCVSILFCKWPYSRIFIVNESWSQRIQSFCNTIHLQHIYPLLFTVLFLVAVIGILHADYAYKYVFSCLIMFFLVTVWVFPESPMLTLYALVSLLPFLKLYLHEVHLAYAVAPMAIIMVQNIFRFWDLLLQSKHQQIGRKIRGVIVGVIVICVIDSGLNVFASYSSVKKIYKGDKDKAEWIKANIPKGSIIIGNFIDLKDILHYAPEYYQAYFSITPNWEPFQVETGEKLIKLIDETLPNTKLFLLGAIFNRTPSKYSYHHLHYLKYFGKDAEKRHVFITQSLYPYADPLKYFIPDQLTSYPGPPDLVDDYWVGRERGKTPFVRECYTDYLLLSIDNLTPERREKLKNTMLPGQMVDSYKGFNIFIAPEYKIVLDSNSGKPIINSGFVVLDQNAGAIDVLAVETDRNYIEWNRKGRCFIKPGLEEVKAEIDKITD